MKAFLHYFGSVTVHSAAIMFAILFALPMRAQSNTAPEEPHALGLRPPTVEEEERMRVLAPRVLRVLPNARALARANIDTL